MSKTNKKEAYFLIAQKLLEIIGNDNFKQVTNCVNRVRFEIKNKGLVNDDLIDQVDLVKGHVWVGDQLQIVFGTESALVKETIDKVFKNTDFDSNTKKFKSKTSFGKSFIGIINGVFVPLVPWMFFTVMMTGIGQILVDTGVVAAGPDFEKGQIYVTQMDWPSALVYVLVHTQLTLLSVFFCYSTVKYMKGDPVMGIVLGLLLASPFFFTSFAQNTNRLQTDGWSLWEVNGVDIIKIRPFPSNIIPSFAISVVYCYFDRFLKKIVPIELDLIIRPIVSITVIFFLAFLVLLPILWWVQYGVEQFTTLIYDIPFGIGGLLFGLICEPFVLFGISWPTLVIAESEFFSTAGAIPLRMLPIVDASTLTIMGSVIAVAIKNHNLKEKTEAISSIGAIIFGSSEVAIFGTLSKKPKTFWLSIIGPGFTGMILAAFNLTRPALGGYGLLAILGFGTDGMGILWFLLIALTGAIINFALIMLFWNEKYSEKILVKHSFNKIIRFVSINNRKETLTKTSRLELKKELDLTKIIDQEQWNQLNKTYYKNFVNYQNHLNKLIILENKLKKVEDKDKRIDSINSKKAKLSNYVNVLKKHLDAESEKLTILNNELFQNIEAKLNEFLNNHHLISEPWMQNSLWNAVNDNLIVAGYQGSKNVEVSKEHFYQSNNKYLLKILPKVF